jgi:cell wall-associated NlpC family hydrolase
MKNNSHPKPFGIILAFLLTFGSSVFAGFLASILISKSYWGYYFSPPELPQKVEEFEKIRSITPVSSIKRSDGSRIFKIDTSNSCIKEINSGIENLQSSCGTGKCNTEYCDSTRILVNLSEKGKLPKKTSYISVDKLNSLYNYLEKTELLYEGKPGYNGELVSDSASGDLISKGDGKRLEGIVVEAEDKNKQPYLFIAANGGQVSNDHYPYYEFLFELLKNESSPKLIANNRFFYEIAGLEGILQWYFIWIFFIVIGFILSIPITFLLIRMKARLKPKPQLTVNSEQ